MSEEKERRFPSRRGRNNDTTKTPVINVGGKVETNDGKEQSFEETKILPEVPAGDDVNIRYGAKVGENALYAAENYQVWAEISYPSVHDSDGQQRDWEHARDLVHEQLEWGKKEVIQIFGFKKLR